MVIFNVYLLLNLNWMYAFFQTATECKIFIRKLWKPGKSVNLLHILMRN